MILRAASLLVPVAILLAIGVSSCAVGGNSSSKSFPTTGMARNSKDFATDKDTLLRIGKDVPIYSDAKKRRLKAGRNDANPKGPAMAEEERVIQSTGNATRASFGIMFDITAKSNLLIASMDIQTKPGRHVSPSIYTKHGSFEGFQQMKEHWTLVSHQKNIGDGTNATHVPFPADHAIIVPRGSTQGIYIFLESQSLLHLSVEDAVGTAWEPNEDLTIHVGLEVHSSPFQTLVANSVFLGAIRYQTIENLPASSTLPLPPASPPSSQPIQELSKAATIAPKASSQESQGADPSDQLVIAEVCKPNDPSTATFIDKDLFHLETAFTASNFSYGIIFEVMALSPLQIHMIDFLTSSTAEVGVQIWTRQGSYDNFEQAPSRWTKVTEEYVLGKGLDHATSIAVPPVTIPAGKIQSFYLALSQLTLGYLDAPAELNGDGIAEMNHDLQLLVGSAMLGYFREAQGNKVFSGAVYYSIPKGTIETGAFILNADFEGIKDEVISARAKTFLECVMGQFLNMAISQLEASTVRVVSINVLSPTTLGQERRRQLATGNENPNLNLDMLVVGQLSSSLNDTISNVVGDAIYQGGLNNLLRELQADSVFTMARGIHFEAKPYELLYAEQDNLKENNGDLPFPEEPFSKIILEPIYLTVFSICLGLMFCGACVCGGYCVLLRRKRQQEEKKDVEFSREIRGESESRVIDATTIRSGSVSQARNPVYRPHPMPEGMKAQRGSSTSSNMAFGPSWFNRAASVTKSETSSDDHRW